MQVSNLFDLSPGRGLPTPLTPDRADKEQRAQEI